MKSRDYIFVFLWGLMTVRLIAQEETARPRIFSFHVENDVFTKTDYHYTSGLKLNWLFMDIQENQEKYRLLNCCSRLFMHLPFLHRPESQHAVSLSIGQNVYTPQDITCHDLIVDDRPYAGVTYLGIGFHSIDHRSLTTWDFKIGIVGPHSFAGQFQTIFHRWTGNAIPPGWHNQLQDEPILNVGCERKWRILYSEKKSTFELEVIPHLGAALGNLITYSHTGSEFRFGWNIPSNYGTYPIHDTGGHLKKINKKESIYGFYFFGAVDKIFVLLNMLLDGNTFRLSHHVDRVLFVFDTMAGVGMRIDRLMMKCAWVYRSKTFKTQRNGQMFGSIILSFSR